MKIFGLFQLDLDIEPFAAKGRYDLLLRKVGYRIPDGRTRSPQSSTAVQRLVVRYVEQRAAFFPAWGS